MEKFITLSLKCPHCNQSLMDINNTVNGKPGIKVSIETPRESGTIWLCSKYGCYQHRSTVVIQEGEVVKISCPHCNETLVRDVTCKSCKAPMIGFYIEAGGKVSICSRVGCKNHYIVFDDSEELLNLFYEKFGTKY